MNAIKGNTENQVDESETNLNDVRFCQILENSQRLTNALRDFNAISRKKFGELVGTIPIAGDTTEKEYPSTWVDKVLHQQELVYEEINELYLWIDSV